MEFLTVCRANLPPRIRDQVKAVLTEAFGGWSLIPNIEGGWRSPSGSVITEKMDLWEVSLADTSPWSKLILSLGEQAGEQAVYVVIGTKARILNTSLIELGSEAA